MLPMKSTLSLVVLILVAVSFNVAQTNGFAHTTPQLYQLYSWQQTGDIWNFRLLASPSGVNVPAKAVFSEEFRLTGLDALKRKISELPAGAKILWMNRIVSGANAQSVDSKNLAFPPENIIEQVKRYARAHGVEVEIVNFNDRLAPFPQK